MTLSIEVLSHGPALRITTPKLDFGLCALGDTKTLTLRFENESARDAKWMLVPAPLPKTDTRLASVATRAAQVQAAALGLPFPPPPLLMTTWGAWDDLARNGEPRRVEHGLLDATLLEAHGATGLRPSLCCGTLKAHSAAEVVVTLDAAAEQSMRRLLELKVEDGGASRFVSTSSPELPPDLPLISPDPPSPGSSPRAP